MKEKVIQDSEQQLGWKSYILFGIGVLVGIVIVSIIKHQEINWMSISRSTGVAALLFLSYFLFRQRARRVEQKDK